MSQLVRLEGNHSTQNAHCAVVSCSEEERLPSLGVSLPEGRSTIVLLVQPPELTQGVAFALSGTSRGAKHQVWRLCHHYTRNTSTVPAAQNLPQEVGAVNVVRLTWRYRADPSRAGKFGGVKKRKLRLLDLSHSTSDTQHLVVRDHKKLLPE